MTKRRLRLLVVEDETLVAMDLEDMLEQLGHEVAHVAGTAEGALGYLGETPPIDAALLDANLGGRSGMVVAKRLAEKGIPFVVTSGYARHELFDHDDGAPRVSKPYGSREIDQAIRSLPID